MIVPDVLYRKAETMTDRSALVVDRGEGAEVRSDDGHGSLTFGEWSRRSDALAHALIAEGIGPGDRVGIAFENRDADRFCIAYFAALKAGGVAVPLGARMVESEVDMILAHAEPRVVIAEAGRAEAISAR